MPNNIHRQVHAVLHNEFSFINNNIDTKYLHRGQMKTEGSAESLFVFHLTLMDKKW